MIVVSVDFTEKSETYSLEIVEKLTNDPSSLLKSYDYYLYKDENIDTPNYTPIVEGVIFNHNGETIDLIRTILNSIKEE